MKHTDVKGERAALAWDETQPGCDAQIEGHGDCPASAEYVVWLTCHCGAKEPGLLCMDHLVAVLRGRVLWRCLPCGCVAFPESARWEGLR